MPHIHPTAIIGPDVTLADDVTVGPYAVLEGVITLGPGCVVHPHAQLVGRVTAGANNDFGRGCIIGERPQHTAYKGEATAGVVIGDGNSFREHVTVHRAMPAGGLPTRIGNRNMFMANAHVGHDAHIGDDCVFVISAIVGGHSVIADRVNMSAFSGTHQHVRVGRLAFFSGWAGGTQDIPPFWVLRDINRVVGVNVVGMRRAGVPAADIAAVREAFKLIYLKGLLVSEAAGVMERQYAHSPAVQEVAAFIRSAKRGVPGPRQYRADHHAAEAA
jgi:UDP-N-acetylglucosamine acyltransferase